MSLLRTRWSAVGAAVAVTLGAGGIGLVSATQPSDAATFVPITPCRLFDTRPAFQIGDRSAPLGPGDVFTVNATGDNGDCTDIPTSAIAVSMNMTATDATAPTFLTVWAADAPQPDASSMNPVPGAPAIPNGVTTALDPDGKFRIYNLAGSVHVLADVNGYYVDHDHDDRYYTQSETDERYYGFGQTLLSAAASGGASKFDNYVAFPDSGSPTMMISFGLPPGRDAERPILVQLPFSGPPNCVFVLSATGAAGPFSDSGRFLNAGWSVVGSPSGGVALGMNPPGSGEATTIVTISHNHSGSLGAGATVEMRLVRDAANPLDTCTGSVSTRGGYSVEY